MSFVNAHFIAYVTDLGYGYMIAAGSFSMIGAAAIVGVIFLGHLSDKNGRRQYLGLSYGLRAVGFGLILLSMGIPFANVPSFGLIPLILGIILVGLSWNSVVAITAAYTSDRFGVSHLGTIYGMMFAMMPLGSGLGAALGGVLYDVRGSYDIAIWSNIVLLIGSVFLILSVREKYEKPLSSTNS